MKLRRYVPLAKLLRKREYSIASTVGIALNFLSIIALI